MKKQAHNSKSILFSQFTATVSVSLVLLMLGIITLIGLSARSVALSLKDEVGLTVMMSDTLSVAQAEAMGHRLMAEPYVSEATLISADQVLEHWSSVLNELNDSTLGTNPFLPEWHLKIHSQWLRPDSLSHIAATLKQWPGVEDATYLADMAKAVDHTEQTLTLILLILAGILALISFVLISNTVRLAVHSRRLSIHAMQLVGAKGSFIRRPFLLSALFGGMTAATIACVVIAAALFYIYTIYPEIFTLLTPAELSAVAVALYIIGMAICSLAAIFATNRYLRRDYDQLFN